jgi:hypothetical protein
MYHLYDISKEPSKHGELPEHSHTLLFGENNISVFTLSIDGVNYELYEKYDKFNLNGTTVELLEGEYYHCNYKIEEKELSELKGLKCVSNTHGLGTENLLFFATNNKIKYYL